MGCTCSENWQTSKIAASKGWQWRVAVLADQPIIDEFLANGGTGSPSIDLFARQELLQHSDSRYSSTFLLIGSQGQMLGFVSNAMSAVEINDADLMGMNMLPFRSIPALFLHRLGVRQDYQGNGIGKMLVWRVFEILKHSCINSAAAFVALLVDPKNERAKALYRSLGFERVEAKWRDFELLVLPYDTAVKFVPKDANSSG